MHTGRFLTLLALQAPHRGCATVDVVFYSAPRLIERWLGPTYNPLACPKFGLEPSHPCDSPVHDSPLQAFSIIGFLANAAILAAICLQRFGVITDGKIPKMAVPAAALGISFCYMLVCKDPNTSQFIRNPHL